jgi:hypothetical protein
MDERNDQKTRPQTPPREAREPQTTSDHEQRGPEQHTKPWDDSWKDREGWTQQPDAAGVDETTRSLFDTRDGGATGEVVPQDDSGIVGEGSVLTADGDLAIDGGHLAGTQDTFEGELQDDMPHVPGAGDNANTGLHNDHETGQAEDR